MEKVTKLLGGGSPIGMIANAAGGIMDTVANVGRLKLAKKQLKEGGRVGADRLSSYNRTYGDLLSMAEGAPTFKADLSGYEKMIAETERQKMEANQAPPDALYREDARQTTANTIQGASRGARSATDLMSIAGMAGNNESKAMRAINAQSQATQFEAKQRAGAASITALGQRAGAMDRASGMEFESEANRRNSILGLTREKGIGMADMQYNNSQEQMARQAALQESRAALWSGIGDTLRSVGTGVANANMQKNQMEMWRSMYPQKVGTGGNTPQMGLTNWNPSFTAANGYDLNNLISPANNVIPKGVRWGAASGSIIKE